MIYFLLPLAIISAIFSMISKKEEQNLFSGYVYFVFTILSAILLFILYYKLGNYLWLLIPTGLLLIYFAFLHLGILKNPNSINEFYIQLFLIVTFSAISHLDWSMAIWGPLSFLAFYITFNFAYKKIKPVLSKTPGILNHSFELLKILDGIYLLIFGLTFATKRINFLEKLIHKIFL